MDQWATASAPAAAPPQPEQLQADLRQQMASGVQPQLELQLGPQEMPVRTTDLAQRWNLHYEGRLRPRYSDCCLTPPPLVCSSAIDPDFKPPISLTVYSRIGSEPDDCAQCR